MYYFRVMPAQNKNKLIPRPPVVVVMGHVDHGKTKLLDYIRKTSVAEHEAGGITQHIGAYEIAYKNKKITFLDTPGHEAFSKIRGRGAKVADIAVLVIAADDGVKPQTLEALEHIKKAELPFIVAINKIDKPEANPEKVKKELADNGVLVESWGGKVPSVEISAKAGKNINELLDLIELLAELGEFKADPEKPAEGVIIETRLDPRRGTVVSLLILDGTIRAGDYIASGKAAGRIKILEDFRGEQLEKVSFSSPALVIGFSEMPLVGEKFITDKTPLTPALKTASQIGRLIETSLEEPETKPNLVYLIIKGDTQSSIEALEDYLKKITLENGAVRILKSEIGNVNESDVKAALVSRALLIAFDVKVDSAATSLLQSRSVGIISGNVIYEVSDRVKKAAEARLTPKPEREEIGRLNVLAVFRQEKSRQVVGGRVTSGKVNKGVRTEVLRNEEALGQGRIASLEEARKETGEVSEGKEAGLVFEPGEPKIAAGDVLVFFRKL